MNTDTHNEDKSIDLFFLLSILFEYKWFIIITTGICAGIIFLFTLVTAMLPPDISPLPDIYHSKAMILIDEKKSTEMFAPFTWWERSILSGNIPTAFSYGGLALKLLTSNTLLNNIGREFSLHERYRTSKLKGEKVRQQIRRRLFLNYDEKTMILTIRYEDYDPEMASKIANRFVTLLKELFLTISKEKNQARKKLIEEKLSEVNTKIGQLEAKVKEFQSAHGVLDVEKTTTEKSTIMANLRSQLYLKEMELKTYRQFSTIEDPVVMRLRAERNNLLNLIREMESGYSSYQEVLPSQKALSDLALEYSHLKRDLLVQEKIYEILIQDYELLKLSLEGEATVFQVIEYADVPDAKFGPHRMWICVVVTFIGFVGSILLVFIYYWIKQKKHEFLNIINGSKKAKQKGASAWLKR